MNPDTVPQEGITPLPGVIENADDEVKLRDKITKRIDKYRPKQKELIEASEKLRKYYYANYVKIEDYPPNEAPVPIAKFFSDYETVIPIVTRTTPTPQVDVYNLRKNKAKRLQTKLVDYLQEQWQVKQEMQKTQEQQLRNLQMQKFVCYKWYYEPARNKLCTYPLTIDRVIWPFDVAKDEYSASFIAELVSTTLDELIEKFPEKEREIRMKIDSRIVSGDSQIDYWEYWENDFVAWKYEDILLGYAQNPYYNYSTVETDEAGQQVESEAKNHFEYAQKPYIIETDIQSKRTMIADTSDLEISVPTIEQLDKLVHQVMKNARISNGIPVIAGQYVKPESAEILDFSGSQKVYLEGATTTQGAVDMLTPSAISPQVVDQILWLEKKIDDNTGAYSTVRGEREAQETATGRQILKEASYGRLEPKFRMNERIAQKIYAAWVQALYVFGDQGFAVTTKGDRDNAIIDRITTEELREAIISVMVKDGSTVPVDKRTKQAQAADDRAAGNLSLIDYLRIMEYEDPDAMAMRWALEQTDPVKAYVTSGDEASYSVEAIRTIISILDGTYTGDVYNVPEMALMEGYGKTLMDYISGEDFGERVIPFDELDEETQYIVQDHASQFNETLKQMVAAEKQRAIQEQQIAEQMGMSPEPPVTEQPVTAEEPAPEENPDMMMA